MKLPQRRQFLHLAAGAAALSALPRIARAQAYPTRPITIVVPFAAGGGTDVAARVVGEHMSRILGQRMVVENVPGAGGTTGSTRAMRAASDGYTIAMGHMGTHAVAVSLYPNLAYRPDADLAPIGLIVEFPALIVARKDFPPNDLKEFVAYVKANSEKLNMGHAGVGSNVFNFGLVLNSILGAKPTLVPFNGAGPAASALLGGQVDYMLTGVAELGQQVQAGAVKAYALAAPERHPMLPNVPTTNEAGLPTFQASPWFALFAPKNVAKPILDQLSNALDQALNDAEVQKRLSELGGYVPEKERRGQQPLAVLVASEIPRWAAILKAANAKLE